MIERKMQAELLKAAKGFPVLTLTGPRQSGKTTLVRMTFPDFAYINLENPETLMLARQDPRSLFRELKRGVIIDEVQKVPELFSWAQVFVDELGLPGKLILTGSNQFEYIQGIGQSLAGRTAIFKLMPLSLEELDIPENAQWEDYVPLGFYPRLYTEQLESQLFYSSYVITYLERDVRNLMQIKNLREFERFVSLCANRTGQILNLSSLATDCAVDTKTISSWLSILEASFLIYLMKPYHSNLNKRLIKAPKLYFLDVGVAAYLMGISDVQDVLHHPLRGELFETMVVGEAIKYYHNRGIVPPLSYFRDANGHEIDLMVSRANRVLPIEIKSGHTVNSAYFSNINYIRKLFKSDLPAALIFADRRREEMNGIRILGWDMVNELLGKEL